MRGKINEQELRERIAYIHGRIEREIEGFAASLSLPTLALTTRLGALLLGVHAGDVHRLSNVPLEAWPGSGTLAEVEGAGQSHGGEPRTGRQLTAGSSTGQARQNQVTGPAKYWADKSPEERAKEMARRRRKWTPEARAKWMKKGGGKKKPGANKKARLYQARHQAKKNGLAPPPLPSEKKAA